MKSKLSFFCQDCGREFTSKRHFKLPNTIGVFCHCPKCNSLCDDTLRNVVISTGNTYFNYTNREYQETGTNYSSERMMFETKFGKWLNDTESGLMSSPNKKTRLTQSLIKIVPSKQEFDNNDSITNMKITFDC